MAPYCNMSKIDHVTIRDKPQPQPQPRTVYDHGQARQQLPAVQGHRIMVEYCGLKRVSGRHCLGTTSCHHVSRHGVTGVLRWAVRVCLARLLAFTVAMPTPPVTAPGPQTNLSLANTSNSVAPLIHSV